MREISKQIRTFSKQLRTKQTPWEAKLWYYLRAKRFYGIKFKRQVPIGQYIVDFCADSHKLIIELDGGQHNQLDFDKQKDAYLKSQGYKVLHIWNNDVDTNIEAVLDYIRLNM